MTELGENRGFALEPLDETGIFGQFLRQDFDRDLSVETDLGRAVDLGHSSAADLRIYAVHPVTQRPDPPGFIRSDRREAGLTFATACVCFFKARKVFLGPAVGTDNGRRASY